MRNSGNPWYERYVMFLAWCIAVMGATLIAGFLVFLIASILYSVISGHNMFVANS